MQRAQSPNSTAFTTGVMIGQFYPVDHSPVKFFVCLFFGVFLSIFILSSQKTWGFWLVNRLIIYLRNILHWFPTHQALQGDAAEIQMHLAHARDQSFHGVLA